MKNMISYYKLLVITFLGLLINFGLNSCSQPGNIKILNEGGDSFASIEINNPYGNNVLIASSDTLGGIGFILNGKINWVTSFVGHGFPYARWKCPQTGSDSLEKAVLNGQDEIAHLFLKKGMRLRNSEEEYQVYIAEMPKTKKLRQIGSHYTFFSRTLFARLWETRKGVFCFM